MHCHLVIPHLLDALDGEMRLPAFEALAACGRTESLPSEGVEAWLCAHFGFAKQWDWPVAPLAAAADGLLEGRYWLCADPVHLSLQGSALMLGELYPAAPTKSEADALIDAINAHFGSTGLRVAAVHPEHWYLALPTDPEICTTPLASALGGDIKTEMPRGPRALHWAALLNELQMVLHAHPVNQARETRGQPTINSLWPWGGGWPPEGQPHAGTLWTHHRLARAIAKGALADTRALPPDADRWFEFARADGGPHLIVLDQVEAHLRVHDLAGARSAAAHLDRAWGVPLRRWLRQGRLTGLALSLPGASNVMHAQIRRPDLFRWWRRPRPLARFAPPRPLSAKGPAPCPY
ncbi:MAG: hypothetical protein M0T84_03720 [Betaproteobacteria bacterium]|nr:hypothetical protein [Betaproteobacteria bacterium]